MAITLSGKSSSSDIFAYSLGEGVNSLITNSISGFLMLCYTEAFGLSYKLVGLALSLSILWDALIDPVMGHISDNTRCRFGRRHPYILGGGILMIVFFYFLWNVPEIFAGPDVIFWYLVIINILLRTALAIFIIPYVALGFEVCTDYADRSKLQGIRMGLNMLVNLAGPAMAWALFFKDTGTVKSTNIASNYVNMATAFSIVAFILIVIVVFATRKYIVNTRESKEVVAGNVNHFWNNVGEVFSDKHAQIIFIFNSIVIFGIVVVSSLQMYVYVYYMNFSAVQKSIVHGSTMLGAGLGALLSAVFACKVDKKQSVLYGIYINIVCSLMLAVIFLTGLLPVSVTYTIPAGMPLASGIAVPVSMLVFMFFHAAFWLGNGIIMPQVTSMIADISEVNSYQKGRLKNGTYSALYTFIFKISMSTGMLVSALVLDRIGFVSGLDEQSPKAIWNLAAVTFLGSIPISFVSIISILPYPVTRAYIDKIRAGASVRNIPLHINGSQKAKC